jgi:putative molybdopterin biosynthesis protein
VDFTLTDMTSRLENKLAEVRRARGWSQSRTAESAGITRQSYAAIEGGSSVPSTEVALRLGRVFDLPVEALFRLPEGRAELVRAVWAGSGNAWGSRVRLVRVRGRMVAYPTGEGERPIHLADGVVQRVDGDELLIELLPDRPPPADLAVVGCDPAFGVVSEALRRERGVEVALSPRGSRAALEAVARGEAHVAGAHLVDPDTGIPNERYVRELVPFACTRIVFASWEQGLLVRAGNPKGIASVADLARSDVRLINREPGSGSRMLLDERLAGEGVSPGDVAGYGTAARSHFAVGEGIAAGIADAGVAIRAAGAAFGLQVIPLRVERYELVVPDHLLDHPAVGALLDLLGTAGIRSQVESLAGYDAREMGKQS